MLIRSAPPSSAKCSVPAIPAYGWVTFRRAVAGISGAEHLAHEGRAERYEHAATDEAARQPDVDRANDRVDEDEVPTLSEFAEGRRRVETTPVGVDVDLAFGFVDRQPPHDARSEEERQRVEIERQPEAVEVHRTQVEKSSNQPAILANTMSKPAPRGNVPYAATSDSEFADVR